MNGKELAVLLLSHFAVSGWWVFFTQNFSPGGQEGVGLLVGLITVVLIIVLVARIHDKCRHLKKSTHLQQCRDKSL